MSDDTIIIIIIITGDKVLNGIFPPSSDSTQ